MILTEMYKKKPETYFTQILEEYSSKRDNKLYTEKDINISFIENKIGILVVFERIIEKRYIETGFIPIRELHNNNNINKKNGNVVIINPWECEISNEPINNDSNKNSEKVVNTYILTEENKLCSTCNGSGKLGCNNCGGNGELSIENEIITCNECNGNGFFVCNICNGTGKVKQVNTLVQEIERDFTEKTFIIDEAGSVQILHQKVNTDFDFLKNITSEDIINGNIVKFLQRLGIEREISNNFIISIIPFLNKFENDTKISAKQIKLYSFPLSIVYCKIGTNPNEVFTFVGKDYLLIEKSEFKNNSSELEKEFQLLSANLKTKLEETNIELDDENKNKISSKILILSILGTFLIMLTILIIAIALTTSSKTENNVNRMNISQPSLHTFQVPTECQLVNTKEKLDALLELSETYVKETSFSYAISTYSFIADCYIKSNIETENIHIYNRIAELLLELKNEKSAIEYYSKAFVICQKNNLTPEQAFFLEKIGSLEFKIQNYEQSIKQFKLSSELYKRIGDFEKEIETLFRVAECYTYLEEPEEAYSILEYVFKEAETSKNNVLLTRTLLGLAEIEIMKGIDTKTTEKYIQQAQQLATEKEDIARLNYVMGKFYYNRNKAKNKDELLRAEEQYKKAGSLYLELENYDKVASILNSLGIILIELSRYNEAEEKLMKSLELRKKLKSRADEASVMFNIAYLKEKQGKFSEAVSYMENVVRIDEELKLKYVENDKLYLEKLQRILKGVTIPKRETTEEIIKEGSGQPTTTVKTNETTKEPIKEEIKKEEENTENKSEIKSDGRRMNSRDSQ